MSLVRTLMSSSVTESVDLGGYDYSDVASTESYFTTEACESLARDIFKTEQAFYTADIMGEVMVIQEGANPEVLLEGIIKGAIEKLKDAFKKFLAKIKEWAAKVKKFFKVIFMKGKELADTYGREIENKSVKGFKYKGYQYKIDAGNSIVDAYSSKCDDEICRLLGASSIDDARKFNVSDNKSMYASGRDIGDDDKAIKVSSAVKDLKTNSSTSDYQDKFVKSLESSCESVSELIEHIDLVYRNNETEKYEIEDFEGVKPRDMVDFLKKFDKAIADIDKEERKFESDINTVIKQLDSLGGKEDKDGEKTTYYTYASKISGFIQSALTVKKSVIDAKVRLMKEMNTAFVSTLKTFLLKKEVKEAAFFEDFDDLIALTEGDAPEPEVDDIAGDADYYSSGRSKKGVEEECRESLLEAAYNWM